MSKTFDFERQNKYPKLFQVSTRKQNKIESVLMSYVLSFILSVDTFLVGDRGRGGGGANKLTGMINFSFFVIVFNAEF